MVYNAKGCITPNTKLHWKEQIYICEIDKYKPMYLTSFYTSLMNIPTEENT